jgi:hypothetical protein
MHDGGDKAYSFVQVITSNCVSRSTLSFAWNGRNAKDIILAQHGGYREFKEVYIHAANVACDVAVELKKPTRFDAATVLFGLLCISIIFLRSCAEETLGAVLAAFLTASICCIVSLFLARICI